MQASLASDACADSQHRKSPYAPSPLTHLVRTATWFADHAVVRGLGERKEAEAKPDRESVLWVRSAALRDFLILIKVGNHRIKGGPNINDSLFIPFVKIEKMGFVDSEPFGDLAFN